MINKSSGNAKTGNAKRKIRVRSVAMQYSLASAVIGFLLIIAYLAGPAGHAIAMPSSGLEGANSSAGAATVRGADPEQMIYSSAELIKQAKDIDGQDVVFRGEAIGSIMERQDGTWLNVSDGLNAVGIFDDSDQSKKISMTGRYQQSGDVVTVKGKFNKACPIHNGELDIHAASITIETSGFKDPEILGSQKIAVAIVLVLLAALIFMYYARRLSEKDKSDIAD